MGANKIINNFLRVNVHLRDGTVFALSLHLNYSLEHVARLIEAEIAFRKIKLYAFQTNQKYSEMPKEVEVYQIYDAFDIALPLTSKVNEILKFDDDLFPVTFLKGTAVQRVERFKLIVFLLEEGISQDSPFILSNEHLNSVTNTDTKGQLVPCDIKSLSAPDDDHEQPVAPTSNDRALLRRACLRACLGTETL